MNIGKGSSNQLKNNAVERFVGDKIILVAGGAGFIGSHYAAGLLKKSIANGIIQHIVVVAK